MLMGVMGNSLPDTIPKLWSHQICHCRKHVPPARCVATIVDSFIDTHSWLFYLFSLCIAHQFR